MTPTTVTPTVTRSGRDGGSRWVGVVAGGVAVADAALGSALLARPPRRTSPVASLLGARLLVQASVLSLRPGRTTLLAAAVTDLLHAASMLPVALLLPDRRRPALASAAFATATALASVVVTRSTDPRQAPPTATPDEDPRQG